jgi:hypothetical protein
MRLKENGAGMWVSHSAAPRSPRTGCGPEQSVGEGYIHPAGIRLVLFISILFLFIGPIGCFSKTFLNPDIPLDQGAHIKGDSSFILYGVVIDAIDSNSLDFANSAYVSPGNHRLKVSYYIGGAPNHTNFLNFSAQAGRKYVVKVKIEDQWTSSATRYFFWVEDVKTGEVVGETAPFR